MEDRTRVPKQDRPIDKLPVHLAVGFADLFYQYKYIFIFIVAPLGVGSADRVGAGAYPYEDWVSAPREPWRGPDQNGLI